MGKWLPVRSSTSTAGGSGPDPGAQRDVFEYQHHFGEQQRTYQDHRETVKRDSVGKYDYFVTRKKYYGALLLAGLRLRAG